MKLGKRREEKRRKNSEEKRRGEKKIGRDERRNEGTYLLASTKQFSEKRSRFALPRRGEFIAR
jgi:septal ring factor EnvC (AmiA/AmiB activator)